MATELERFKPAAGAEQRILVHAPRGRDAEVVCRVLGAHFQDVAVCASLADLVAAIRAGAGIAFVTEESLAGAAFEALVHWVEAQPPWSDFPFIALTSRRSGRRPSEASGALRRLGNVVLLERPLNAETLLIAGRAALRGRTRQYETQRHLVAEADSRRAERLANAEALRAKQALEVAVAAGELGTFHCPLPLRVMQCSPRCKEHVWLPAAAELDFDDFCSRAYPDDRAAVRAAVAAAVEGHDLCDVEFRATSPSGQIRWVRTKGRIYRDSAGVPVRFDGVTLDISRQKKLEAEREALLVAEREARLEAERAGRMKDEFLATLSHELRTPLSAILGWTHLLRRPSAGSAEIAKAAATIERNARAQATLIEELLDVSRITSGRVRLELERVSVATVFEAVLQSLKPAADAKGVAVTREDAPSIELHADPARLQQVVWNLVSNAAQFTPPGGRVVLQAERHGDEALLRVADSGAGIAAEFLPHVFERFRQAESSESRSYGGLGLGLAIVRELVELHGGRVLAHSDGLGRGAVFTVALPLAAAARVAAASDPLPDGGRFAADPATALAGLQILVVDDETDGREMLTLILESRGADVRTAASADEALSILDNAAPDLLISDIGMPRVDGYELMRRIRRLPGAAVRELPAIALTAFARPEDAAKARQAGFGSHLSKPVEPAALFSTIATVFEGSRAGR